MKKAVALLLTLLLLPVISACTGSTAPEASGTVPEDNSEEINFYGAEYIFASINSVNYTWADGEKPFGDKMNARFKDTEQKFNITLKIHQTNGTDESAEVMQLLAAMQGVPDFYDMKSVSVFNLYKAAVITDYKTLENLNVSDTRWGTENFLRQVTFKDGIYGVWCYDWESPLPQVGGVMFMNNELITDRYNQPSPHELFEDGTWTWDNFRELLKNTYTDDPDDTVYGLTCMNDGILLNTAIYSNGVEKTVYENGKYVFGYDDLRAAKAMDFLVSLTQDGTLSAARASNEHFGYGKASFYVTDSWAGTSESVVNNPWLPLFNLKNFGWIPFPYGPDAEYGSYNAYSYYNQRFFAMIPTENEAEDIATVMNYLFAPLDNSTPQGWKAYAESYAFFSNEDYQVFINFMDNEKCDYSSVLGKDNIDKINAALLKVLNGNSTYTEAIEAVSDTVNAVLDAELNN